MAKPVPDYDDPDCSDGIASVDVGSDEGRSKKRISGDGGTGGNFPTTEELAACLVDRGFPITAWDEITIGMAINYCCAYDRMKRRQRGENVPDPEQQYKVLKAMEPAVEKRYADGKITEEKYQSYKKSLQRWEMMEDG